MSKRVVFLIVLVLIAVGAYVAYVRGRNYRRFNGGEVIADDVRDNASPGPLDVQPTPSRSDTKPAAGQPTGPATDATVQPNSSTATDTLPPEPPEYAKFSGSGRFQVYRQGNLTWRVDTASGRTCILFATDEEWQNPRVLNRACIDN